MLCSVVSVLLVVVVLLMLYGLGYVSGTVPKMYRNATEGRLTCEDFQTVTDDFKGKWVPPNNNNNNRDNSNTISHYEWVLAQTLQGGNRRVFEERIDRKQTECLET
jgi:hypothetical protein